jgi:hypothetical protein
MSSSEIAIVTPSFARDFELCKALNESVLSFFPAPIKHYVIVDGCDLKLFSRLAESRTVVAAVEDVIPKGYMKLRFSKKWWFSAPALFPAKGWLIQQLVKLCATSVIDERVQVNVDSDVRFVRPVDPSLFIRNGRTRMYRLPGGVTAGMHHVKWHKNICRLMNVTPDSVPMDDYVGNVISWDRHIVAEALEHIERTTHQPWHVAYTRARLVGEQLVYGLYVDKVIGQDAAGVWVDERSWCHTYWGPGPLAEADVESFVAGLRDDDIAFSIAGYTATDERVAEAALRLAKARAESSGTAQSLSSPTLRATFG